MLVRYALHHSTTSVYTHPPTPNYPTPHHRITASPPCIHCTHITRTWWCLLTPFLTFTPKHARAPTLNTPQRCPLHTHPTAPSRMFTSSAMLTPGQRMLAAIQARDEIYLCAVPKKRVSIKRRNIRRAGQRMQKRRFEFKQYKICCGCGNPVLQHHLCMKCKKIHPVV